MKKHQCANCEKLKEDLNNLTDRYLSMLVAYQGKMPDLQFSQQMDIVVERLMQIFPADESGNYTICLHKKPDPSTVVIEEAPKPGLGRCKRTRITIYYLEPVE